MARYDAIYEGRIPRDVHANSTPNAHVICHQGFIGRTINLTGHIRSLSLKFIKDLLQRQ